MAAGAGAGVLSLSSCVSFPVLRIAADGNKIPVDAQLFTAEVTGLLLREKRLPYDILLVKTPNGYRALYMLCTHNAVALSGNQHTILCTEHGSEFDFEGSVKKGPATARLRMFKVSEEAGKIVVHLAG